VRKMEPRATIDFETRSTCDLRKCGSWKYSLDPSTEVLCLVFRLPYWDEGVTGLWHPAFPHLGIEEGEDWEMMYELLEWIADGGLVEAHSAWFERSIWANVLVPRHLFIPVSHRQWRCSAAKAATHALPRGLEDAVAALNLQIEKDMVGAELMKKLAKPRKPNKTDWRDWARLHAPCSACKAVGKVPGFKKDGSPTKKPKTCPRCKGKGHVEGDLPPMPVLWHESKEQFERLWDYCRVDVLAEEGLSDAIPDLNDSETEMYLMDQAVNERGFLLDVDAVQTALDLIAKEQVQLNAELRELTGNLVERATQRDRMLAWLAANGLVLDNTQAATIDSELQREHAPHVQRALELMRALGRSSTAKYEAMRNWMCPDGRVRGGLLYHGANTGRWSGAGVQPHNFPKGHIQEDTAGNKWDMETAWDVIKAGSETSDDIEDVYGDGTTLEVLSQALRGAIVPTPGKHLYVADYAAIEARVLLWEAEDDEHLGIFRRGEDIYCTMASSIYGYKTNKKDHPSERALGKVAVLGLGYQMGWEKFIDTCMKMAGIEISEELSQRTVSAYREKFWRVKQMWADQEAAALKATTYKGIPIPCGRVVWKYEGRFLYCILPSGRRLAYPFAKVATKQMPWGDVREALSFKGINPVTRQWHTQTTYGGMLVENQTQAIARDLMAEAMLRCEQSGVYVPILSVHDELIAEADPAEGDVKEFEALMALCPDWAEGCPVEAEGWSGIRYRK
jgi:DNA polymerase